jgi:phage tail-like protein
MAVLGTPRETHGKWKFVVVIDGFDYFFFQKCSEISVEFATAPYYEGGSIIPVKTPGRATFPPLTLERGASRNATAHAWALECGNAAVGIPGGPGDVGSPPGGSGVVSPGFRRNGSLYQRDRDNTNLIRYDFFGAWVKKFVAGDWDNTADEIVIEKLELEYDFWERVNLT